MVSASILQGLLSALPQFGDPPQSWRCKRKAQTFGPSGMLSDCVARLSTRLSSLGLRRGDRAQKLADAVAGFSSGMIRSEALERRGGVPVLRRDDDRKAHGEGIAIGSTASASSTASAAGQGSHSKDRRGAGMHVSRSWGVARSPRASAIRRDRSAWSDGERPTG